MAARRGMGWSIALLLVGGVALLWSGNRGLGLVCLAGVAGVLAAGGLVRVIVGVLMLVIGLLGGFTVLLEQEAAITSAQRWVAGLGVAALIAAGLIVIARGRRWSWSGARYETGDAVSTSSPTAQPTALDLWRAIDRGEDPTARIDDADGPGR